MTSLLWPGWVPCSHTCKCQPRVWVALLSLFSKSPLAFKRRHVTYPLLDGGIEPEYLKILPRASNRCDVVSVSYGVTLLARAQCGSDRPCCQCWEEVLFRISECMWRRQKAASQPQQLRACMLRGHSASCCMLWGSSLACRQVCPHLWLGFHMQFADRG